MLDTSSRANFKPTAEIDDEEGVGRRESGTEKAKNLVLDSQVMRMNDIGSRVVAGCEIGGVPAVRHRSKVQSPGSKIEARRAV